ncbi:protein phosphatase 2A regulatory subunit B, partial [Reticulomyxa filosa]
KYVPGSFLQNVVKLLTSEDIRERGYVMMILHKIYARCSKLRTHIVDLMCNFLYPFIHYTYDSDHCNGVTEILQIVYAIIPGLSVPIKDIWRQFLQRVLIPLHKVKKKKNCIYCHGLKKFWSHLTQCCLNYIAKDKQSSLAILEGLLRFWPKQYPQKEELFIMEAVNVIGVLINHPEGFVYDSFKPILVAASKQLSQCMLSKRHPVALCAISAWKEPCMSQLVDLDRKSYLPMLAHVFFRNQSHSNPQLRVLSQEVEYLFRIKDISYWKKMQSYLLRKEVRENNAEEMTTKALAYGEPPPFPCKLDRKRVHLIKTAVSRITQGEEKDEKDEQKQDREEIQFEMEMEIEDDEMTPFYRPNDANDFNSLSPLSTDYTLHVDASKKKHRPYDSFALFTLQAINDIDYSSLVSNVRQYEQITHKSKQNL